MTETKESGGSMEKAQGLLGAVVRSCRFGWGFAPGFAVAILFLNTIVNVLPLVQAKIAGTVVTSVVESLSSGLAVPVALVVLYGVTWGLSRLSVAVVGYFDKRWYIEAQQGVDLAILRKRLEIDLAQYENAEFQNLLTRAFDRGNWPILNLADAQFSNVALIVGVITSAVVAIQYPLIFMVVFLGLIPSFVVELRYGNKQWSIWSENSPRQRLYATIRSHINGRTGIMQTKMLQAGENLLRRAKDVLDTFKREQIGVDRSRLIFTSLASVCAAGGVATAFFLIVRSVTSGVAEVGDIVFLTGVLGSFAGMSTSLLSGIAKQYELTLYARDIFRVFDTEPKLPPPAHPVPLHLTGAPRIEFRDVSFRYEGQTKWVLRHVSFVIEPGQKVALVGENGTGKTTLFKLLSRVYDPTEGEILVNGVSLRDVDPKEWGSALAILLQDYRVHEFTVSDAIGMGRSAEPTSFAQAESAARLAGAHGFITELSSKYDTQIGREFENGIDLSHGQGQRVALARTIYREGKVIVLDEPTASVDAVAEERFFRLIGRAVKGKTLLLVSHRFNTVQGADRILVFRKGELVEDGTHTELLAVGGYYAKMWRKQARSYIESGA